MDKIGSEGKNAYWFLSFKIQKIILALGLVTFFSVSQIFDASITFACDDSQTIVKTRSGKFEGVLDENGTLAWKGIPFARPPVGKLRWRKPIRPRRFRGVRQADEFCDLCTQYSPVPEGLPEIVGSEDCLYLNVWRPNSEETDLPVYFWIHGGGNSVGSAVYTIYDGSKIASNSNLIVVTTNYRLGPLGWFTNPVLRKGKKGTVMSDSGNFGTLDIMMALKWVKKNIAAFGGDPDNVTIAGESAGAQNVYSLLLSPIAAGLFHKAISQSGGPGTSLVADGDASSDEVIDELMAIDGISRDGMKDNKIAHYLRKKTAQEILSVYEPDPTNGMLDTMSEDPEFRICFQDGTVIHAAGAMALFLGQYNKVPIILGSNKEEHKMFMTGLYYTMSPCAYQTMAENITEMFWNPAVDAVAPLLRMHQTDVYAYRFIYGAYRYIFDPILDFDDPYNCRTDLEAFNAWPDYSPYGGPNLALMIGSWHFLDVPFFFGNFEMLGTEEYIFNPTNYPGYGMLSDAMMAYVAQFARAGDPGDAGGVNWLPWSNTPTGPRILFDADKDETLIEMSTP